MLAPPVLRSLLFVPGGRPDLFPKALKTGADALILDLEDAVAAPFQDVARDEVKEELARSSDRLTFVRINHPDLGDLDKDLAVLAAHGAQAIMLPKVCGPKDLKQLDNRLSEREQVLGLPPNAIGVCIVIETSLGLRNLFETLTSTPRIRAAGLASAEQGDLMFDLGGRWTPAGEAMAYARGKFVCDARAAGVPWLIDGAFMNLEDPAALQKEAELARTYGFNSKVAIHPRQVEVLNRAFSPTPAELERARGMLEAFQKAEAQGRGAIQFQGMMVDYANIRWARQILAVPQG
ncbi:MAG: CoA ester lyase [Caulobacteraceae bacterium]|nr:CoA ester lyase [Caulobacteraceae bacterium]